MKVAFGRGKRAQLNRRAFLRGAGTLAVGLPFLESMPWRSAWAQSDEPVFSFFICQSCGVVDGEFWPNMTGPAAGNLGGYAVSALEPYADRLLIVRGVNFPLSSPSGCGHAQGLSQVLTGVTPSGNGPNAAGGGPSIDTTIASQVNPNGTPPLAMYAGLKGGYINERLSFVSAGQVRAAEGNPYQVYRDLVGLAPSGGMPAAANPAPMDPATMGDTQAVVNEMAVRRNSVNDFVREELNNLKAQSVLSRADRDRLDLHFGLIRDIENTMVDMEMVGAGGGGGPTSGTGGHLTGCTTAGLDAGDFERYSDGRSHRGNGSQEDVALLHLSLVAFAFACNLNRTGTLQIGDGTDATVYNVPSNGRGWGMHHISHRMQSDGQSGNDQTAVAAHVEIDALRMQNFKLALDKFAEYTTASGTLFDNSMIVWTNHVADGPSHRMANVPYIIVGSGGGYLKQGQIIAAPGGGGGGFGGGGGTTNDVLLNTIKAAVGIGGGSTMAEMIA